MLIAGWGKDAKVLAFVGLMKCQNCNNYSMWYLVEISSKVKVYFIPVAKYGSKYFVMCNVCENGYEVDKDKKNEILEESVQLPEADKIVQIWGELEKNALSIFGNAPDSDDKEKQGQFDAVIERLKLIYTTREIEYTLGHFLISIGALPEPNG